MVAAPIPGKARDLQGLPGDIEIVVVSVLRVVVCGCSTDSRESPRSTRPSWRY